MRILIITTQKEIKKVLIVFDDMIVDIITQSYFSVPKDVRLNTTHYLVMKIDKRELQNIAINHSADTDHQDFMKIYRECTREQYNFFDNIYYVTSK